MGNAAFGHCQHDQNAGNAYNKVYIVVMTVMYIFYHEYHDIVYYVMCINGGEDGTQDCYTVRKVQCWKQVVAW